VSVVITQAQSDQMARDGLREMLEERHPVKITRSPRPTVEREVSTKERIERADVLMREIAVLERRIDALWEEIEALRDGPVTDAYDEDLERQKQKILAELERDGVVVRFER
jgi:hypothetical protein